jgi:hypothetical protein
MKAVVGTCLVVTIALSLGTPVLAQESKSAPLAQQLASALAAAKLDSIAARDPAHPDVFVGGLFYPGSLCLFVSARYSAPSLLNEALLKGGSAYREIYMDLSTASAPESRIIIQDTACDGLKPNKTDNRFDVYEAAGKRVSFDGESRAQKLTEEQYNKAFADADEQYARMLTELMAQLKKKS